MIEMMKFFVYLGILHLVAPLVVVMAGAIRHTRPASWPIFLLRYLWYFYRGLGWDLIKLLYLPPIALQGVLGLGAVLGLFMGLAQLVIVAIEVGQGHDIPDQTARDGQIAAIAVMCSLVLFKMLLFEQKNKFIKRWTELVMEWYRLPLAYLERRIKAEEAKIRD